VEDIIDVIMAKMQKADQHDYIGEPVSQLQHALQCAYFAEQSNHSEEVVLASLLHDVGHFISDTKQNQMAGLGIVYHEWIGAKWIYDLGFSAKVALLVGYHVDAKRYLAAKKPGYSAKLSMASKGTLAFQGGPMSLVEMELFEQHIYFKEILQVRINDEKAKEINLAMPDIYYYRPKIKKHLEKSKHFTCLTETLTHFVDQRWVEKFKERMNTLCY
jgi:predicted HD phosphohydrolase